MEMARFLTFAAAWEVAEQSRDRAGALGQLPPREEWSTSNIQHPRSTNRGRG